ncbi:hypothetical protein POTOM_048474 [Populus tomentosa]|uniref:Uncharacterized protein n=1 Tax=Populus tomentosa TaxID=118781 RepID=A0A8X7YD08_POPTO|nr:hypothetical protein POTOM_048474 [Populus tomentosa]
MEKPVVYRANVMRFTEDSSSQISSDVAEPIISIGGAKGAVLSISFLLTIKPLRSRSVAAVLSIKEMAKKLHAIGIELLPSFGGEYLSLPLLVEAIAFHPLLSKTKIIPDCWDPRDLEPKETTFPHWKRWAKINAELCQDVRNFLRGECLLNSDLATRLCGSRVIFSSGQGPPFSFNFGIPVVDMVFLFLTWELNAANLLEVPVHEVTENLLIGMRCQRVLNPPRWEDLSCKFLVTTLKVDKPENGLSSESSLLEGDMFIAFIAAGHSESVPLPEIPEGMAWHRLVDPALPFSGLFSNGGEPVI